MNNKIQKISKGRPTKYIPDIIYPKIDQYLTMCGRENTELPTVEGLAQYINVNADTIFEWAKRYPDFSEYIKKLKDKQKNQLINDGMYGGKEVNSTMAIFLLKAIHGLKENDPSSLTQINIEDKNNTIKFVSFKDDSTS